MYDLKKFSLRDMVECGLALRKLGKNFSSMEESSEKIVGYLYEHLRDRAPGENTCALVRLLKTHPYGQLDEERQKNACREDISPSPETKCLTLLAAAGQEPQPKANRRVIPLMNEASIAQNPPIAGLVQKLELSFAELTNPDPASRRELSEQTAGVFYLPDARSSSLPCDRDAFGIPEGIQSLLAFGSLLPSGELWSAILFLKTRIPRSTAEMFEAIALSIKTALLPFDGGKVFSPPATAGPTAAHCSLVDAPLLHAQIATLTQLLDTSERTTLGQSDRLERLISKLRREVIERHRTTKALRESQGMFSGILDIAEDGIISVDETQRIQLFNQGAEQIFGYAAEEVIGQPLTILLPSSARKAHPKHIRNFGKNQTVARTMAERTGASVCGRRKNGEEFPAEASISKLKVGDGFLYTVMLRDITERKQAEQALQNKNQELATALQQLQLTQDELIQSEKMAALGQLVAGVAHEINTPLGAIRSSVEYICDFLDRNLAFLSSFFQELSPERQEIFLRLLQRSDRRVSGLTSRERRKRKKALIADLENRELDRVEEMADLLMELGVYKDFEFLVPLLREPDSQDFLQMVYQFSCLQESANDINLASDRAAKVVFALKTYARYDYQGEKAIANITDSIETVLTLYYNQCKHGVEVIRNYQEIPPLPCYIDELNQVWTNLVHNALQAMKHRGTLTIDAFQDGGHVRVKITDSGKGIPEDILHHIFDPFFTTKPPGEGSGLGLDIVKKIIEKHQGEINVESVPGKTSFTVSLPIPSLESSQIA